MSSEAPVSSNSDGYVLVPQREADSVVTTTTRPRSMASSGSSKTKQYIAAMAVNLATMAAGIALGWTSPSTPILQNKLDTPLQNAISDEEVSWVGSLIALGAVFGPFAAGISADKMGRKLTLLVSAVPFVVAWFIIATTCSLSQLYVARFLCGISVGAVFTVVPMYVGELAEDSIRGALGSFIQLFVTIGLLFSYVIGPYVSFSWFAWICCLVPIAFVAVFSFIPESPYFLMSVNKRAEASEALENLRGISGDELDKELAKIKEASDEAARNKGSIKDILKNSTYKKALILSMGLAAGQQLSGINVVLFYTQKIFSATGSDLAPEICTIIIGVVQVLSSFLTSVVVDRLGRKILLLGSAVGMAIGLAALGLYFQLDSNGTDVSSISFLPIVSLVFYIIVYCLGFGPLPWAVMGELFPGNIKSVASTATAAFCWLAGFIMTVAFDSISKAMGMSGAFFLFTGFCVAAFFFVLFLLPETKGKSLQEIQELLGQK